MSTPDSLNPGLPAGLPDPAVLARLAGEFFAALPGVTAAGGVPVPSQPHPPGLSLPPGIAGPSTPAAIPVIGAVPGAGLAPTSPQAPANVAAQAPSLVPHAQAPNGVPDLALVSAPGYDGRIGSHVLGIPQAPAAGLPLQAARDADSQQSYYFLVARIGTVGLLLPGPGRGRRAW